MEVPNPGGLIMKAIELRWCVIGLCAALMAGCGGGSTSSCLGGGCDTTGNPATVTATFPGAPTVVAARIGNGAFAEQTLSGNTLTLSIPSGTTNYSMAYLCPQFALTPTEQLAVQVVAEASTKDGTSPVFQCSGNPPLGQIGMLTGEVDASGIPGAGAVEVVAANGDFISGVDSGVDGVDLSFGFSAPAGSDRVGVFAMNTYSVGLDGTPTLLAAKTFSSQMVPGDLNGGNPVVLSAADETSPEPITYINVPSGYSAPAANAYFEMSGANVLITYGATNQYPALPAGAMANGDLYSISATAYRQGSEEGVWGETTQASSGPVSITFPSPWTYLGPTPAVLPVFNFDYSGFSSNAGVLDTAGIEWTLGDSTNALLEETDVVATANYLNGSKTVAIPDLSSVPGFAISPNVSGYPISWFAEIEQSSSGVFQSPSPNATASGVQNSGGYTLP